MMTFTNAFKRFWRGYADFSNRATRAEYWWNGLWLIVLSMVVTIAVTIAAVTFSVGKEPNGHFDMQMIWFTGIIVTGLVVIAGVLYLPTLAIWTRRLRDTGLSLPVIIGLNMIVTFIGGMTASGQVIWQVLMGVLMIGMFILSVLPSDAFKKEAK